MSDNQQDTISELDTILELDTISEIDEKIAEANRVEGEELEALKLTAQNMGLEFHPNIGLKTLKDRVNEKVNKQKRVSRSDRAKGNRPKEFSLVRVTITCLDPNQRHKNTHFLSVGNSKLGFTTKHFKMGVPYHIPRIFISALESKLYSEKSEKFDPQTGKKNTTFVSRKAYHVQILPMKSQEELEEMATDQKKRGVIV